MSAQKKPDESVLHYMGRLQDNVAKALRKPSDANRQDLAVSMFCQALGDQDVARMTAIQAKGDVSSALRIAASPTAYAKNQHYSQRYEPSRRRYPANVAVDDDQQDDDEEVGDDGDADAENQEQDEEVLYAGPPGKFRSRGRRRRRSRYGSPFRRRGYGPRQAYAYPQRSSQPGAPTRPNAQGPPPSAQAASTSTGAPSEQQQPPYVSPDKRCYNCNEFGHTSTFCPHQDRRRPRVNASNQCAKCGQALHDGPSDPRNMSTRNSNQPPQAMTRGGVQRPPSDQQSRTVGNAGMRTESVQTKMESNMIIADEQQQDEQADGAMVMGGLRTPSSWECGCERRPVGNSYQ